MCAPHLTVSLYICSSKVAYAGEPLRALQGRRVSSKKPLICLLARLGSKWRNGREKLFSYHGIIDLPGGQINI